MANLKQNIELVILESYKKAKERNFSDLNYVFTKNQSPSSYLKGKIKIFNNLDEYSQTFLSIHTRAKLALREFKSEAFEGSYLELLRLILTLPEELNNENLKSKSWKIKEEAESLNKDIYKVGKNITIKEEKNSEIRKNTVLVKENITGKKLQQEKEKSKAELEELNEIDFEDVDFEDVEVEDDFNNEEYNDIDL